MSVPLAACRQVVNKTASTLDKNEPAGSEQAVDNPNGAARFMKQRVECTEVQA